METFGKSEGLRRWSISCDPEHARWIETFSTRKVSALLRPAGTDPFLLLARAKLRGGQVAGFDLSAPAVARLSVNTAEGTFTLVLELSRPAPNLLLLDADERVRGAQRSGASTRELGVGQRYTPPIAPRAPRGALPRTPPPDSRQARALDERWNERLAAADLARARSAAGRVTRQAVTRLERRLERLEVDRLAAAEAEQFRRWGDLLKIHGGRWRRGATELHVPDEFDAGRPEVTIPLDPAESLTGNIARLFRQYRKRRAASSHVQRRLAETERELRAARAAAHAVAEAQALPDVERALQALPGRAPVPPAAPGSGVQRPRSRDSAPHVQRTSSDGWTILVGRSAKDNDELTFGVAKGRDWWLHAVGFSGSHVVVRNPAGGALPRATLREAAWLAAYYSKARSQGRVEVAYVERKHVRRVPRGKPGAVTFDHGHTVWVDVADENLARVLRAAGSAQPAGDGSPR